jgi:hypothetical protein
MKERHIPLEVFLKKDFGTNLNERWQIHQDDIWTRMQNEDDLRFEYTDEKPSLPIGRNRLYEGAERYFLCELYLHDWNDVKGESRAFFLEPLSKNDIVYKLKH